MASSFVHINSNNLTSLEGEIYLPGSKSISNRALIIKALADNSIHIENLSEAKDTQILQQLLESNSEVKDCGMAGTTLRFLTAYLVCKEGTFTITGAPRMLERPIAPLVDALLSLGADIEYLGEKGFPPLKIKGKPLKGGNVSLPANISSQYISALMMIAPTLSDGMKINLINSIASKPYIEMTASIMRHFGAEVVTDFSANTIEISSQSYQPNTIEIEGDWSSASYYYSLLALADSGSIKLIPLYGNSWQGDIAVSYIYFRLGITTFAIDNCIILEKTKHRIDYLEYNFSDCPDLAQTVICTCAGLGIEGSFKGLHTLRIKETDRILALQQELAKLNWQLIEEGDTFHLKRGNATLLRPITINTYNDHRMAMAFAPLSLVFGDLLIENPAVVEKSNPNFWKHLKQLGFEIKEVEPE